MKVAKRLHEPVLFALFVGLLAGCGASGSRAVLPGAGVAAVPQFTGAVGYLRNMSPFSSSGIIAAGTRHAIVALMSAAFTDDSPAFSIDTLSLSSGAASQSGARAQTARMFVPRHRTPVEAFTANERALLSQLRSLAVIGAPRRRPAVRAHGIIPSSPTVGDAALIWVQRGTLSSGARTNVQIPAKLIVQTAHGNIWIDRSLLPSIPLSAYAQIGADFENAYASDVEHFASPDYPPSAPALQTQYRACAADGSPQGTAAAYVAEPADRRINAMIVDSGSLGGLGGYFSGVDYMPQPVLNCLNGSYRSDEAPFIFVGWFAQNGSQYELREDLVRGMAHELQHLINFVNHAMLPPGSANPSFDGNEQPFINEGLSMLAQDLAVARMYASQGVRFDADDSLERAQTYLANPQNYSVSGFAGIDSGAWGGDGSTPRVNCAGGCYGAAYLFERYLYDRFGSDAYSHAVEVSGSIGPANLKAVTGEDAASLLDDFALALAAGSVGADPANASFSLGSLNIVAAYPDQFGGRTVLGGIFAPSVSGSNQSVQAPVGGFAFVSEAAIPASGMPILITDEATAKGFALHGGLAQH